MIKWIARNKSYLVLALIVSIVTLYFPRVYVNFQTVKEIEDPKTKSELRSNFDRQYNYTELFLWEHQHLNFTWDKIERNTNPLKILEYGKGRCAEFAILYAGLCEAHGYDARIVVNISGDHAWVQIKLNNTWTHFDPSLSTNDPRIKDPFVYERDWNANPILVLAFDETGIEDVTETYRQGFWINIFSLRMLALICLSIFIISVVLSYNDIRKRFYKKSFQQKSENWNAIGKWYEKHLPKIYLFRFLSLLFLLPALAFLLGISNPESIMTLLLAGLGLVTFFAIEFPLLTKPNFHLSIIRDCENKPDCKIKVPDDKKECKFMHGDNVIDCRAKELFLEVKEDEEKIVFFRLQNLSLHTLKNCVVWFTFPKCIKILHTLETVDFYKEYQIQRRNNAVKFTPIKNHLSISPTDCLVLPVKICLQKNCENIKDEIIKAEVSSETTWSTYHDKFPVKIVN